MVTVNGLTPAIVQRNHKAHNKSALKNRDTQDNNQTSKVASAVAQSIRAVSESDLEKVELQYDLPEGHSRRAMEQYMDVFHHAKKEHLAKLLGVDIYI
ncbi:chromosome partitioning protein ParA [Vibrio sp. TH_r3]|uniref:chromosome partitioning protein ParA n=1 Tax=Vibrio sp. TH_r3 TaxID=3082084 RepID=UPI0029533337|nr:chromosome partitioning protein ParA [Vibrio sp. TH_r3]MDV7104031.1 chromosome partitioning protein ParA [Vibrio sp. TH_r3]